MPKRLTAIYPKIWPIAFLAGGILTMIWGGHLHVRIFGEMIMVNLHTWMWFLMALAHAEVFWRPHGHNSTKPNQDAEPAE